MPESHSHIPNAGIPDAEVLLAELLARGATMEEVARLKDPTVGTPDEALDALKSGNQRFYASAPQRVFTDVNQRRAQIMTQTPFAVVLGCSDSRVPIEIVFDQGPGDIFSIRVAGNVVEGASLASVQYAVRHLKVRLIVVLGHEGCGAVSAALLDENTRAQEPAAVRGLLDLIVPSLDGLPPIRDNKARMREAVILNVRAQKAELQRDELISAAVEAGQVKVVGGFYEIGSGAVDFLED